MYLYQRDNWWQFSYNTEIIMNALGKVRAKQGLLLGKMSSLGFDFQEEATLATMSLELVRSCEIEGEFLNLTEVRSSIACRLGINNVGLVPVSRYIDGIAEMLLDAVQNYNKPLTDDRLFGWHSTLFPTGRSGLYKIDVAQYRTNPMQVVSGAMGREKIHYEAPKPQEVPLEMKRFLNWFNTEDATDPVLKAGIAHLWFISIHPFDDGNGRIARAITDMLLTRSECSSRRFYSMSNEMKLSQKEYYKILEKTQKGDGDITEWLLWFLYCLEKALSSAEETHKSVLTKARFWEQNRELIVNQRQKKIINMQFDGFFGKLTTSKWAKLCKCSPDTALNDIKDLINKGVLKKNNDGGRSTNYSIIL